MGLGWSAEERLLKSPMMSPPPPDISGEGDSEPSTTSTCTTQNLHDCAEWKTNDSGILRPKKLDSPQQIDPDPECCSSILEQSLQIPTVCRGGRIRKEYEHFVDFSLFPDKFSSSTSTSSSSLGSSSLRTRSASTSEAVHDTSHVPPSQVTEVGRHRSASYSSSFFIPDSPVVVTDMCAPLPNKEAPLRDKVAPTVIITPDAATYNDNGSSVVAVALTMFAVDKGAENVADKKKQTCRGSSSTTRFNYFDYSMIPDKDPKAFVGHSRVRREDIGKASNNS